MPVIPKFGRWRQENQEFMIVYGYIQCSKTAGIHEYMRLSQDIPPKKKKEKRKRRKK